MAMYDPMDERSARFAEAYSAWRYRRSQHKRSGHLLTMLLGEYRKVWATGDIRGREEVLDFLRRTRPPGSEDLVWANLRSRTRHLLWYGLAVALGYISGSRGRPSAEAVSDLMRLVKYDCSDGLRFMALHVLTRAKVEGLDGWLHELADGDPSPSIRREANIALMRKGDAAAKAALLQHLREHPDSFGVADDLWQHRQALDLTGDEERELRGAILQHMESVRRWLRNPGRGSLWFEMLGLYARDGFPFEEEDVQLLGRFATSASDVGDRVRAVRTLAAFDTPQARNWLEYLASGGQPGEIARRARRALRTPSPRE